MNITGRIEEIAALAVSVWRSTDPTAGEYASLPEGGKAYWRDLVRDTASAMASGRDGGWSGTEKACATAIRVITAPHVAVNVKEENAAIPVSVGSDPAAAEEQPKRGARKKF